ncbi:hypothetical protein PtA15_5A397 [Puccinia triticina]|uniref:Biogenesis of lysosome-related organelles complex 1 subunit 7 n=1 Tax=Puccinia triticina TaxID=208348 RepID=A0ABY7CHW2_9BASI|nr:uncharacterized protein PtA15_5A397 [Puccinia triticina]WAQ84824.1 hypothetical protein PtA15_5A397 [Puccinia triticina]
MNRHTPPDTTETQGHTQQAPLDSLLDHLISISSQLIDSSTNALASTINSRECLSTLSKIENVLDRSIRIRQRDLTRKLNSIESHQLELDKIQDQLHSLCPSLKLKPLLIHPEPSSNHQPSPANAREHHNPTNQLLSPSVPSVRSDHSSILLDHHARQSFQHPSPLTVFPPSQPPSSHASSASLATLFSPLRIAKKASTIIASSFATSPPTPPPVPASTLLRTPSSIDASQSGTSIAPSPPPPNNLHHQLEPAPSDNHHPP